MAGKNTCQIVTPPYGPIGAVNSPKSSQISGQLCGNLQPGGFSLTTVVTCTTWLRRFFEMQLSDLPLQYYIK